MRVPQSFLNTQELSELEEALGRRLDSSKGYVSLVNEAEEAAFVRVVNSLSESAEQGENKVIAIRAANKLIRLSRKVEGVADQAAIVAAVLSVYQIDQDIGKKLLRLLK